MHTTFELWQAALQDPILAPVMQGVFPRDKLPIVNKHPSRLIANTDPHDQPGHIGWPCTSFLLGKVNSLTVTGFLPIPMAWMDT